MTLIGIRVGHVVMFQYKNHRGEIEVRNVVFSEMRYGSNQYYPEDQFFLHGHCLDRDSQRSFAVKFIKGLVRL